VTCHTPSQFTDNRFHNDGAMQLNYDSIFGEGAFDKLYIPDLATRNARAGVFLPPSQRHPSGSSRFRSPADRGRPGYTDLGVWNIIGNSEVPTPQTVLMKILCNQFSLRVSDCTPSAVLPRTVAHFKTPTLRDLGQSDPYLHSGSLKTIEDVLRFYIKASDLARRGRLRNGSPELSDVHIDVSDIAALAAFLKALNEDYR
jgi:cytochrome c peroxidase